MELNLAPWYYRNLIGENQLIETPLFYKVSNVFGEEYFESNVSLKSISTTLKFEKSSIYNNCDGSGADSYKNIAIYKAISEALERMAFYESINVSSHDYGFGDNPTTTGMAAYPHFNYSKARLNAQTEAVERWAVHQFNKSFVPVVIVNTNLNNLEHFELITPFRDKYKISLIAYKYLDFYVYSFAGGKTIELSFRKALIELNRNLKILLKNENYKNSYSYYSDPTDRTLIYYSSNEGYQKFKALINSAPSRLINTHPKILCDSPIVGRWSTYTKVWRYLLEDSYFPTYKDHTFFMF